MKTYITEWFVEGKKYGDEIEALTWEEARKAADARGRGEEIIGELVISMPVCSPN